MRDCKVFPESHGIRGCQDFQGIVVKDDQSVRHEILGRKWEDE